LFEDQGNMNVSLFRHFWHKVAAVALEEPVVGGLGYRFMIACNANVRWR